MLLLGMVGFGEGVIAAELVLMCFGVFLLTCCALLGLFLRSRGGAVAGLLLLLATAYLFQPWQAFVMERSTDWDAQSLRETYLGLARWWVLASLAAVGATVWAFWPRGSAGTAPVETITSETGQSDLTTRGRQPEDGERVQHAWEGHIEHNGREAPGVVRPVGRVRALGTDDEVRLDDSPVAAGRVRADNWLLPFGVFLVVFGLLLALLFLLIG
jgi:hypothetical protein